MTAPPAPPPPPPVEKQLLDAAAPARLSRFPAVVALGGGHGLAASLAALRLLTDRLTAVVTVADDGGSSGRLRAELPALLPPGDLRMALCALAADDDVARQWAGLLQHRFPGTGEVGGHAVGNLLLAGLLETLGDPVTALDRVGALVGAAGRVLPLAAEPLDIEADVRREGGSTHTVRGQVAVATTTGRVLAVRLVPSRPRVSPETVSAVRDADWVVLGPGSLFTSQLPHLLVPAVAVALAEGRARTAYVLNLAPQPGETDGFSPAAHLEVLASHAPELRLDIVVADSDAVPAGGRECAELIEAAAALGAHVLRAPVAVAAGGPDAIVGHADGVGGDGARAARHDPRRLAAVLRPHLHGTFPSGEHPAGLVDLGRSGPWRR